MKVVGPAVLHLGEVFKNSLRETRTLLKSRMVRPAILNKHEQQGVFVQVLQSNVRRNKRHLQKALVLTLRQAQSHCFITTPYFLPAYRLRRAIIKAARRGVTVKILTAVRFTFLSS